MQQTFLFIKLTTLIFLFNIHSFAPVPSGSVVQDVLSETNQFRRSKGLGELILNSELNSIAQQHSADMANGRVGFGHSGFEKRNALAKRKISIRSFGENVAYGATSGKDVVEMWKNSSGHRKNLLGHYKYLGIGIAKDTRGRIFYTQVFAG